MSLVVSSSCPCVVGDVDRLDCCLRTLRGYFFNWIRSTQVLDTEKSRMTQPPVRIRTGLLLSL